MSLPISMLCDRVTTKIPDAQLFFMGFFVEDLVKTLNLRFPNLDKLLEIIKENKEKWTELKSQTYYLQETV